MARARIARALRPMVVAPGWEGLVNRLVPEHHAPFSIRNGDTAFAGDIGSFVDRQVYLFGGYESADIECFVSCIDQRRRGTVLDIGANVGTHSLAFARVFKTVHSFEPNPMLWEPFERNMALNGLTNVSLHRIGLADRDSEMTLYLIDKPNYGLGTFSPVEQYDLPLSPAAVCTVRNAGGYLAEVGVGRVDAVKIDVQGFEPEVLRGLSGILRRDRPVVWCEMGAGTLTKVATIRDLSELIPFEFRCYRIVRNAGWSRSSASLRELTGDLINGDCVFVPR